MIASLPMYDWAELRPAHDEFWSSIAAKMHAIGIDAPACLNRNLGLWDTWNSPDLFMGQTCGMPYRQKLHGTVHLVGTPDYGLTDAPAGHYYSQMVVRVGETGSVADFRDRTLAYNGHDSQSGWAAPQNLAAEMGFQFSHTLHTGAHRESAFAVAEGRADIAAIDAVTWRLIERYMPDVACRLMVLDHTTPTPGLPFISAYGETLQSLRLAVESAIDELRTDTRSALGIGAFVQVPAELYLAVPTPAPPSQDMPQN